MGRRGITPLLTEEQREEIRRGWYPSRLAEPYPGELEQEHAWRIARRADSRGLEVNARDTLKVVMEDPRKLSPWEWFIATHS